MTGAEGHENRALHAPAVEPTRSPRFSVRFARGQVELVLGQPLLFEGGVLHALVMSAGAAPRVTDFTRGWRALSNRRTALLHAELSLDVARLGLPSSRDAGWWLAATVGDRLLVERERPWGHVALELGPTVDGADLLLVPLAARSFFPGPGVPLGEIEDIARAMMRAAAARGVLDERRTPRLDGARGAIDLGDALQRALTDALVPHGLRVPELGVLSRSVRLVSGGLSLTALRDLASEGAERAEIQRADALSAERRELGRRLGPALVRACAGATGEELTAHLDRGLPSSLKHALGQPIEDGASLEAELSRLRAQLAVTSRATFAEAALSAQRIDGEERSPGIATDALLATMARAGGDQARARELLARAFARSPSRPDVLAASLELASSGDARLSREVLREVERVQRERGQRIDPWLDVALARAEEQLGEHDAAFERWERAARSPLTLPETFEGLAKELVRRGRLSDALASFERAAELYRKAERVSAAARAKLSAAHIALSAREPHAALARVQAILNEVPDDSDVALLVDLRAFEARAYRECGEPARAERADLALARLVDHAGSDAPDEAITALIGAARAILFDGSENAGARADALLEVVARVRPNDRRGEELRRAELAGLLARVAASEDRSLFARRAADALRARARPADAALVLTRAGELDRDLTLLRVAIDLAEKTGDRALFRDIVRRTLDVVGDGPARAALEARLR